MAEQSPTVEIAPTVIVSNSNESENDGETANSGEITNPGEQSGDGGLSSHSDGEFSENDTPPDVAIAEIEAERDITLAAIHDETERERIRLEAERETNYEKDLQECQKEIAELKGRMEALVNSLIPPLPLETEVEEALEIVPETSLTQPSTAAPTVETLTEPSEESEEESPVEEIPIVPSRKFIAI